MSIGRLGVIAWLMAAGIAWAQTPADALAWWSIEQRIEPTDAETARRQLLEATLRTALSSGMVGDDDAMKVITGLLVASSVGATSHQFAILDLDAGEGVRIERLQAVLEIRAGADHRSLMRTMQAVLVDAHEDSGRQRAIQLPGGVEGVAFRRDVWPAWMEVSWVSRGGVFTVGIGEGALDRWVQSAPAEANGWTSHVQSIDALRAGDRMMTLFLDLDGLRRAAPEWFGHGDAPGDALDSWALSNARLFMLHAHLVEPEQAAYEGPPLVVLDATWESRAEPAGTIRLREVTSSIWPEASFDMAPPPGRFAIVAPIRALAWIQRGVGMYMAIEGNPPDLVRRMRQWGGRTKGRIQRMERASAPFVVIGDSASTRLPLMGTLYVEVDRSIELSSYERELGQVMLTLGDTVVFDEATRTWSVRVLPESVDPTGVLTLLAWGMAQGEQPVLVVGWSVAAVEEARKRLAP